MPLSKEKIEEYKKDLLNEKKQIQEELKNLKEGLDFGDDVDSGDEETDESEEFANYIDVKMSLEESLDDINKALEKIKEGTYGICEECEKEIEEKVLEASPSSRLCKNCKKSK
ncbi:MAG TPA: TraR/DksA C4-type zinc finger protein [Candidatus Paceibacterota bacterium]|nr:TraR/DksA C4-type zinc finger protein [Candidatus Paceibacterota bacterium]